TSTCATSSATPCGAATAAPPPDRHLVARSGVGPASAMSTSLSSGVAANAISETTQRAATYPATTHGAPPAAATSAAAMSGVNPASAAPISREVAKPL